MRILHTSDWHIGKKTEGRDRLAEQREVLEEIVEIVGKNEVELLLMAGDVFDSYIPSAGAQQLFIEIADKLSEMGVISIFIAGNHDDSQRLSSLIPLAAKRNIFIFGNSYDTQNFSSPNSKLKILASSEGSITFSDNLGEKVFINAVPYPSESRLKETVNEEETFSQKMFRWLSVAKQYNTENAPEILVAHIYSLNAETASSERDISLGGARAIEQKDMPDCIYTALGHIHKRQYVSKERNIIYSGSIMQFAFDEANIEKSVTIFDVIGEKVQNLKTVPLVTGKKLVRISALNLIDANNLLNNYSNSFVELTLKLKEPLTSTETKVLREEHPNILVLKIETENEKKEFSSVKGLDEKSLFVEYYKKKFGCEPEKAIIELFLQLAESKNEAD